MLRSSGEIESFLRSVLQGPMPQPLQRMLCYHMGWEEADGRPSSQGGKALRPNLCLLACEAAGGNVRRALPAAAAVELVHNFSLIHDDIQDRDRERRHRPTVWSIWGEAQAINAGDALLTLARLAMARLADDGVPPEITIEAARLLDERTLEMVEGQVLDIAFEGAADVSVDGYLEMIEKKTGALFDCSLALGALVAGASSETVETLGGCGRRAGAAYQIGDDVRGIWGAEERTGKEQGADIRRRKKSLPMVYAFAEASPPVLEGLKSVYSKAELSDEDVAAVTRTLERLGARSYCERLAQAKGAQAISVLEDLGPAAAQLREAVVGLVALE